MDELLKLLPLVTRFLPLIPRAKELLRLLEPVIAEARKAAPQAMPLINQLVRILEPTIREARAVWPFAYPLSLELFKEALPEIAAEMDKPSEPIPGDVIWIQKWLNKLGEELDESGTYDQATRDAVWRFQEKHGLNPDGWAGMVTLAAMYSELSFAKKA